jgi:predicted membrane protein
MKEFRDYKEERRARWEERADRHGGHSHIWTGVFLLVIGGLALAKSYGTPMPAWLFSWQMLLIAIGLFVGFRKGFRDGGWFVPIIIGGAFMANDFFLNGELRRHIWPLILIVVGIFFILRSRKRHMRGGGWNEKKNVAMQGEVITPVSEQSFSQDDYIDTTSIFGGTKKVILSKNFRGGDMVNIFGGSEIDLTQADVNGTAVLEVTAIFGGATLIVPANWVVKSEAVTIFGGINDRRRNIVVGEENKSKNLIINGTVLFGGLEIKSY